MNIFNIAQQFLLSVVLIASLTTNLMAFDFKESFVDGYNQYQSRYAGAPITKDEILSVTSISCEGAYAKRGYEVALKTGKIIFCKDMKKDESPRQLIAIVPIPWDTHGTVGGKKR